MSKFGLQCLRQRAGRQRHAHRIGMVVRLARDALAFVEAFHHVAGCAGGLEDEEIAGHAAPLLALVARRGGNIVGRQHRAHLDIVHRQHLGRHVEIHDVAGVVAIHEQHAGAAVHGLRAFDDRIGRWRGENITDGAGVGQPLADVAEEGRLVAGPTADDQPDLSGLADHSWQRSSADFLRRRRGGSDARPVRPRASHRRRERRH